MLPETTVTHLADLRREHLARAGVAKSENLLSEYIQAGLKLRVTSQSGRGNISPEAALIQEARNRRRRAEKCGFQSIEDRVEHDVQFMERMLQMGRDFTAAQKQDWLCHVHLANPPRRKAQVSLGLGYDSDHTLARLAYVDVVPEQYPEPRTTSLNNGASCTEQMFSACENIRSMFELRKLIAISSRGQVCIPSVVMTPSAIFATFATKATQPHVTMSSAS